MASSSFTENYRLGYLPAAATKRAELPLRPVSPLISNLNGRPATGDDYEDVSVMNADGTATDGGEDSK